MLLLALGLTLVAGLTWQVGPKNVLDHFQSLGWPLVFAVLPYILVVILDAVAWRDTFDHAVLTLPAAIAFTLLRRLR
ncbi:MAG: hypothetical protein HYU41_14755 [Candidatus Rokubacteria bacterium]|nr:hypothetical protein [Candidatus Rokubacteria bacterium]